MFAVVESHMQTPHVYVSKISASDMQAGNLPASLSWTDSDLAFLGLKLMHTMLPCRRSFSHGLPGSAGSSFKGSEQPLSPGESVQADSGLSAGPSAGPIAPKRSFSFSSETSTAGQQPPPPSTTPSLTPGSGTALCNFGYAVRKTVNSCAAPQL